MPVLYKRVRGVRNLIPLLRFSKILGLSPKYNSQKKEFTPSVFQKVYSVFLLAILCIGYIITLPGRLRIYYMFIAVENATDIYSTLTTILVNVLTIFSINFWNAGDYAEFLNAFVKLDETINFYSPTNRGSNFVFWVEILVTQVIVLATISTASFTFFSGTFASFFRHYLTEHIERFHIFFVVILLYNFILSIKCRFRLVNAIILNIFGTNRGKMFRNFVGKNRRMFPRKTYTCRGVEDMIAVYTALWEQVQLFNGIFGWIVFILTLNIISSNLLFLYKVTILKTMSNHVGLENVVMISWTFMHLFAKLFAVAPSYDQAKNKFYLTVFHRIFSGVYIIAIAIAYALTLPRRRFLYSLFDNIQNALDFLNTTSSIVINVTAILSTNFWHSQRYVNLLDTFLDIDKQICRHRPQSRTTINWSYWVEVFVTQAVTVSNLISGIFIYFVSPDSIVYRHYVIECLQRFHMYIMVFLQYNLILSVKYRLESVNKIIVQASRKFTVSFTRPNFQFVRIEDMIGVYMSLCEQAKSFNAIFGWVLFVLTLHIICNILLCLYNVTIKNILMFTSFAADTLLISCILMELLMGIMIAAASDMAHREAQETGNICYTLLHELNRVPKTSQVLLLQESLQRLGKQASICCPYFSAGPFLRIDYTWLFVIMQLTTSYFVVILQFKT